jgi:hypothetical protein
LIIDQLFEFLKVASKGIFRGNAIGRGRKGGKGGKGGRGGRWGKRGKREKRGKRYQKGSEVSGVTEVFFGERIKNN